MAMPDAVKALLYLAKAPASDLSHRLYNVTSFSLTAAEFRIQVLKLFPQAQITFTGSETPGDRGYRASGYE